MGNCLRPPSSTKYDDGDDEEGAFVAASSNMDMNIDKSNETTKTTKTTTTTKVKIKITKKQLQELLGKMEVNELKVEHVLAQLMMSHGNRNSSGGYHSLQQRPWRPKLQSIPEIN